MEKVEIFQPMKDETEIKNYMTKKKKKQNYTIAHQPKWSLNLNQMTAFKK